MQQQTQSTTSERNDMYQGVLFMTMILTILIGSALVVYGNGIEPVTTILAIILIGLAPLAYVVDHYWNKKTAFAVNAIALFGAAVAQGYTILHSAGQL